MLFTRFISCRQVKRKAAWGALCIFAFAPCFDLAFAGAPETNLGQACRLYKVKNPALGTIQSLASQVIQKSPDPKLAQIEIRSFFSKAQSIVYAEPHLISNSKFREFQAWTLSHQGYVSKELSGGPLKLVYIYSNASSLDRLEQAFAKYARDADIVSKDYKDHISLHRSMFTSASFDKSYMEKFHKALDTMFPNENGARLDFSQMDCDYTSQPTNKIWYAVNAMYLIDRFGLSIFGEKWLERKKKIQGLPSIEEIQARVTGELPGAVPDFTEK